MNKKSSTRSPDRRFSPSGDDPSLQLRSLRTLGAVFRTTLLAVLDPLRCEHAAQDVVAHAGQILDAAAADHDHRMLLQIVAFTGNVANDLEAVGQTNLGDLPQSRIRLLRRRRIDARQHAALLRARLKRARLLAIGLRLPRLADQLANRRHVGPKLRFPKRPALRPNGKSNSTRRPSREAIKATHETNSALKPDWVWAPPKSRGSRAARPAIMRKST